jgi:uncharacterized DUF497 family protein
MACHEQGSIKNVFKLPNVVDFIFADNPQSNLSTDSIVKSKNENSTYWTVTVISDDNEKSYKEAVLKTLGFATEERIATLAFCLMQSTGKFSINAKRYIE